MRMTVVVVLVSVLSSSVAFADGVPPTEPERTSLELPHVPKPTLRVPAMLILSAFVIAGIALPLFFTDSSVTADDCDDGCFGNRAVAAMVMLGAAGQLFSAGLFVALPLKMKRRREWRLAHSVELGVSASRASSGLQMRFAF